MPAIVPEWCYRSAGMTPAPSPVRWPLLIYAVMIQTLGCRLFMVRSPIDLAGSCVQLYCTGPAWALGALEPLVMIGFD